MNSAKSRRRLPAISIVLFVFAGIAFLLFLYFTLAAFSAPAAIDSTLTAFGAAFGPMANMLGSYLKSAVSWVMGIAAVLNLLVGVLLLAVGIVLRNHRDLAERVAALEARAQQNNG